MKRTKSGSINRLRLPIRRVGFLAVTSALWVVLSACPSFASIRICVYPGAFNTSASDKSADKDSPADKSDKAAGDNSTPSNTDSSKNTAKTNGAAAKASTDEQLLRLDEKVKELEQLLHERQLKADDRVTKLEDIIERQQQKSDEKVAELEEIIKRQQKTLDAMQEHLAATAGASAPAGSTNLTVGSDRSPSTAIVKGVNGPTPVNAESGPTAGLVPAATAPAASGSNGPAPSATPGSSTLATTATATVGSGSSAPSASQEEEAPLSLRLGSLYITPEGFADFSTVFRSTNAGNGLPTNFGSIPFSNTPAGQLTEIRPSAQGTRPAARVDAMVGGAHIIGYVEFDFLGFVPTNAAVVYNNSAPRLRMAFVDVRKDKIEILGGQAWTLMAPDRNGLSPLAEDMYYPHLDPDNQLGLVWNRDPQFRFIYHASNVVTMGFSAEEPEQYIGGFGGAGTSVLPAALATPYAAELNNGTTTLNTPNVAPDFVAKLAFDPMIGDHHFHIELAGLERNFKVYDPISKEHFSATGGGGSLNFCLQLTNYLKVLAYNFYSDGGGRYIFGQAPDLVIRGDGSISLVRAASTVEGMELQVSKKTLLYAYYGGVYIFKDSVFDPTSKAFVGYGFPGASTAQNRALQEPTFGVSQTLWKEPRYGSLQLGLQYSYLTRSPWIAPTVGPTTASTNMFYVSLRYLLPSIAPKLPYSY
ncbi:MAG TPA: hypothetical protein VI756_22345 [Blastocatellia bacterium]